MRSGPWQNNPPMPRGLQCRHYQAGKTNHLNQSKENMPTHDLLQYYASLAGKE
jgi:hypothetical protein